MANTYSQIFIHIIFAVKGRENMIHNEHREDLQRYITGIVQNREHKMLAIYSMPDHTHLLIGMNPKKSLSELVRDIKSVSSRFINESNWMKLKFTWQEGFGEFSYSKSQLDNVIKYILNQPIHHKKTTFNEEYIKFLKKYEIEFDDRYIFKFD